MTTLTLLNVENDVDVDIAALKAVDKTDFVLVDTQIVANDGREAIYQKVAGDEEHPLTVRIGWYPSPKGNSGFGLTNISIKISTFLKSAETDGTVNWIYPVTATLATQAPGLSGLPAEASMRTLVENLFSWMIPVQTGVLTSLALDQLKFGVVNGMIALTNSASA